MGEFSFSKTKSEFEKALQEAIYALGEKTKLRDACEYALVNGGKRIRPLIVFMVAHAIDKKFDVLQPALSIEYFHTASLIVDDLPCMDNDDFRREKPSLHKVFGESTALLASYSLMTAGFHKIYEGAKTYATFANNSDNICFVALGEVSQAAGLEGTTGGQYLDLYPENLSLEKIKSIIEKKTAKLFEISFLYGWLFGGGDLSLLQTIKKIGYHFGMAFQIADDLKDFVQDKKREKPINLALVLGKKKAKEAFNLECLHLKNLVKTLNVNTENFFLLQKKLEDYAKD